MVRLVPALILAFAAAVPGTVSDPRRPSGALRESDTDRLRDCGPRTVVPGHPVPDRRRDTGRLRLQRPGRIRVRTERVRDPPHRSGAVPRRAKRPPRRSRAGGPGLLSDGFPRRVTRGDLAGRRRVRSRAKRQRRGARRAPQRELLVEAVSRSPENRRSAFHFTTSPIHHLSRRAVRAVAGQAARTGRGELPDVQIVFRVEQRLRERLQRFELHVGIDR
jgi:hypothetical protein